MTLAEIKRTLRKELERREMSYADLSRSTGISPAHISRLLHGSAGMQLSTLIDLAVAVGMKVEVRS